MTLAGSVLPVRLSICIPTFNRAKFIREQLESIASQATSGYEVVVCNNASSDDTEQVVAGFVPRFERLRYFRQSKNVGVDRNIDHAVNMACGEYCWLMPDDDMLKPGAVARVLEALHTSPSLVVVNFESRNADMSKVTLQRRADVTSDRIYSPEEIDQLFVDTAWTTLYLGSVVIKRSVWLERNRIRYYDSLLIQVAVIFQERLPGDALLIAQPLVSVRDGNSRTFWSEMFEIFMFRWPELIWSLAPSEEAKRKVSPREPWRNAWNLLTNRAMNLYSLTEYRRWIRPRASSFCERLAPVLIAVAPGVLVNSFVVLRCLVARDRLRDVSLFFLSTSPFHLRNHLPFNRKRVGMAH